MGYLSSEVCVNLQLSRPQSSIQFAANSTNYLTSDKYTDPRHLDFTKVVNAASGILHSPGNSVQNLNRERIVERLEKCIEIEYGIFRWIHWLTGYVFCIGFSLQNAEDVIKSERTLVVDVETNVATKPVSRSASPVSSVTSSRSASPSFRSSESSEVDSLSDDGSVSSLSSLDLNAPKRDASKREYSREYHMLYLRPDGEESPKEQPQKEVRYHTYWVLDADTNKLTQVTKKI